MNNLSPEMRCIAELGGFEYTPFITDEEKYIYESPDGGNTVYRRKFGSTEKELVTKPPEPKRYVLPVEGEGDDCFITLPEELLNETGWKEGQELQWIDNEDGSFTLKSYGNS